LELNLESIIETGEYTLDGFLVTLEKAICKIRARRMVINDIDSFLIHFGNPSMLRKEFLQLTKLLASLKVTAIVNVAKSDVFGREYSLDEFFSRLCDPVKSSR
jgi:KaiC/GvpD/RAD55 family RecA-like ATPase